ncbi:MAG TPA: TetR/AcrR family transcriptional regulator [Polyangiaceae bacterium]|nr:TetR/AcrR family transcriptional regulator [Polyangiaceae bacterium]
MANLRSTALLDGRRRAQALAEPRVAAPRRERNATETKRRILAAAGVEFAAKGFDGARLGHIARRAGIQQTLIHHHFEDKAHLFDAVLQLGLAAMTEGVWTLLEQMGLRGKAKRKDVSPADIRVLCEAFIELLFSFYSRNSIFLAMVSHESQANLAQAHRVLEESVRPLFDAIVARIEEMGEDGSIRRDVDARNLVLSCVAMASFAFQQAGFVGALWPADLDSAAFIAARKAAIVQMVLDHLLV